MFSNKNLFLPVLLTLFLSSPVYSDLVVEANVVITTSSSVADVIFTARDDDGAANGIAMLTGYNIPLDIGGDGLGVPAPISFSSITPGASFGGANYVASPGIAPFNWDAGVGFAITDGTSVSLTTAPLELFTLQFAVDSTALAGDVFDIQIVNPASPVPGALDFDAPDQAAEDALGDFQNNPSALISGQIQIAAAVPEPSSVTLIAASTFGLLLRRRRRC